MAQGLSVGRLIRTTVNLSPLAAQRRGFGTLLVLGDSDVMSPAENPVPYLDTASVGAVYGLNAPEYLEAQAYFGQSPKPAQIMMGRWARTDTAARLRGGVLTAAQQLMSAWTTFTTGTFTIGVGTPSVPKAITVPTLAAQTNLNGVAAQITAGLATATAGVTCVWDGDQFVFTTTATGVNAALTFLTASGAGQDMSTALKGTAALAAAPVPGFAAEAPVDAASRMANKSALWFGLSYAASVKPSDDQNVAVAGFIEGLELERMFGATITSTTVLDSAITNDLASRLKALGYKRTFTQYSANEHAVASMFGRAFSVNFAANRSTITLMYKQEPGIAAEYIDESQAQTLKAKNCNVFVNYVNNTAIIQYGTMASGAYFDEIHGLSWFKDALQNAEFNLLYTSKTKVPQTDPGQNDLVTTASAACDEAVNNGLVAPGQWNADGFGQLSRGDYLPSGYYIFTSPIALQEQSVREGRVAPPLQIAIKLAGAFQELDIIVDVNR
jgi:hypothetical protein